MLQCRCKGCYSNRIRYRRPVLLIIIKINLTVKELMVKQAARIECIHVFFKFNSSMRTIPRLAGNRWEHANLFSSKPDVPYISCLIAQRFINVVCTNADRRKLKNAIYLSWFGGVYFSEITSLITKTSTPSTHWDRVTHICVSKPNCCWFR